MNIFWIDKHNSSLFLFKKYGHWKEIKYKSFSIFFSGFCYKKAKNSNWNITELIEEILKKKNKLELEKLFREIDGHYTIVIKYEKSIWKRRKTLPGIGLCYVESHYLVCYTRSGLYQT